MTRIQVFSENDTFIGSYESVCIPRVGEILDANDGHWKVIDVQHDIKGRLKGGYKAVCNSVVIYAMEYNR